MKTKTDIFNFSLRIFSIGVILLWLSPVLFGQDNPYNVKYDPNTKTYNFYRDNRMQGQPLRVMNGEEYRKFEMDNALRERWNQRRSDETSNSSTNGVRSSRLIPQIKIDNEVFATIFGSNKIDIVPQGSVEIILGVNWNKTDNPTVPEEYRSTAVFDFKPKLQLNATGSIGERLKLTANYNTESGFEFQTQEQFKLTYEGDEDQIIQRLEAGNVSLPLTGSLITGGQNLFGFRADLKFGKLKINSIFSQQRGQTTNLQLQGGAQTTNFDIAADQYDANRHFFLAHYFYNQYDQALQSLPLIRSGVNITRIEVWVTNRQNRFENSRNIVALEKLGEETTGFPQNSTIYDQLKGDVKARKMETVNEVMNTLHLKQGTDYEKIENARKLEINRDFRFHSQLGFISLNISLNNDEVLAVAYEYTANGRTYRVGEFSEDGVVVPQALFVKLLKGTNLSPRMRTWNLMMKNIYSLSGAGSQLNADGFVLDVMYRDDELGGEIPYLREGAQKNIPLIRVLNLDNLNGNGDRYPDGKFDFVDGVTVLPTTGRIIFPVKEPFGRYLEQQINDPTIAQKYVYKELYDSTLVKARQLAEKNKFKLRGIYKSSSNSEIMLGAVDIPQGSVVVTAGGIRLVENVDYTVNYTLGRLQIINPTYLNSNTPINVSLESNNNFSFVTKTLIGTNLTYDFSKDFWVGVTLLNLSEKPMTQKVILGKEPINNFIWGVNTSYTKEVPFLTKAVDALPFLETKAPSKFSFEGEFAHLVPGQSRAIGKTGTTYIDDFEATKLTIDLKQYTTWFHASPPEKLINNGIPPTSFLAWNFHRGKLSWYVIDPLFHENTTFTPAYMTANPQRYLYNHYVRAVPEKEIFPNKDQIVGINTNLSVLNLAYFPKERGVYNYNDNAAEIKADGTFVNPKNNWTGMQRSLQTTDWENANIEYLEMWVLDPFIYERNHKGGKMIIQFGDVSEDINKDARKFFENGIPYPFDTTKLIRTSYGYTPKAQSLTYTFDNDNAARQIQDVGYDGVNDDMERTFFNTFINAPTLSHLTPDAQAKLNLDPSSDNYKYFRDPDYDAIQADIIQRYKNFSGPDGNSPIATGGLSSAATTVPNTEDINKDNTLNELESYYQYELDISPGSFNHNAVGSNFIADFKEVDLGAEYGEFNKATWYQIKIPITAGKPVNGIEDFKSIRFMRVILSGFEDSIILRFAKMELGRGDWRRYAYSLIDAQEGIVNPITPTGNFDVSAVSIEENSNRTPVNYVLPPGVSRVIDATTNQQLQQNEQSLMLTVQDLTDGDARAVFKNLTYDFRRFRRLQMDIHAEAINETELQNGELTLFFRMGTDYKNNYYEYELPLYLTPHGIYTDGQRELVWRSENVLDLVLNNLVELKIERNNFMQRTGGHITSPYEKLIGEKRMVIRGNPDLANVRVLMVGVRNPKKKKNAVFDDARPKSGIIWINELRLSDFDNESGYAANARISTTLADFATVSLAGSLMTANFGSIEATVNQRRQSDSYQYSIATNAEMGKFFPQRLSINIPFTFGYSQGFVLPKYNPFDPDILLSRALSAAPNKTAKDSIKELATEYSMRKNFGVNGIRLGNLGTSKWGVADVANLTAGYTYNESFDRNMNIKRQSEQVHQVNGGYTFTSQYKSLDPFKAANGKWRIFKDFSLTLIPSQFTFTTDFSDRSTEYTPRSYYPDVTIPSILFREQLFNRNYGLNWDLLKNLKFSGTAVNQSRRDLADQAKDLSAFNPYFRNTRYNHTWNIAYDLPLEKIPYLAFLRSNVTYKATFDWEAAPQMQDAELPNYGNTLRNSNNLQLTGNFNLLTLYNEFKYLKDINQEFDGRPTTPQRQELIDLQQEVKFSGLKKNRKKILYHKLPIARVTVKVYDESNVEVPVRVEQSQGQISITAEQNIAKGRVIVSGKGPKPKNVGVQMGRGFIRFLMMVRSVSVTYNRGGETTLPGYLGNTTLLGADRSYNFQAPGWDFIAGSQSSRFWGNFFGDPTDFMRQRAYNNGWITTDTSFFNPYMTRLTQTLQVKVNIEPFKDFRIDLTANSGYSNSKMWYDINNAVGQNANQPVVQGTFKISTISILSSFKTASKSALYQSEAFKEFVNIRKEIAFQRVAERQQFDPSYNPTLDSLGFPQGYSNLSQEVLVTAFNRVYAGQQNKTALNYENFLNKIPLPNWQLSYNGLSKLPLVKRYFKSITLTHNYTSSYEISNFITNNDFYNKPVNDKGDYTSRYNITNIFLNENILLGGIDMKFNVGLDLRYELRKNRRVNLSLASSQIIENSSMEHVVGAGYLFTNIPLIFKFSDAQSSNTTMRLRADFSIKEDMNVISRLSELDAQITDGRKNFSLRVTLDYDLLKELRLRLYYNWLKNQPYISAVNTSNVQAGVSITWTL